MPSRYHSALIALHWLLALLIAGALIAGGTMLEPLANTDPAKLMAFRLHMGMGVAILVLMLLRLVVRLRTPHPPVSSTGHAALDALAPVVHWGLYAAVIAMALSGIALSVSSGLAGAVWGSGAMPPDFAGNPARGVHGILANVIIVLILVHVLGALLHGVFRGQGVMGRMWFGPR